MSSKDKFFYSFIILISMRDEEIMEKLNKISEKLDEIKRKLEEIEELIFPTEEISEEEMKELEKLRNAPMDEFIEWDELKEELLKEIDEAREEIRKGEYVSHEELIKEFEDE